MDEKIKKRREWDKEVYYWRKERGYCVRCGREKALPNRVCCLDCSIEQTERNKAYYHRKKVEK